MLGDLVVGVLRIKHTGWVKAFTSFATSSIMCTHTPLCDGFAVSPCMSATMAVPLEHRPEVGSRIFLHNTGISSKQMATSRSLAAAIVSIELATWWTSAFWVMPFYYDR
jgi:hypothetical protein